MQRFDRPGCVDQKPVPCATSSIPSRGGRDLSLRINPCVRSANDQVRPARGARKSRAAAVKSAVPTIYIASKYSSSRTAIEPGSKAKRTHNGSRQPWIVQFLDLIAEMRRSTICGLPVVRQSVLVSFSPCPEFVLHRYPASSILHHWGEVGLCGGLLRNHIGGEVSLASLFSGPGSHFLRWFAVSLVSRVRPSLDPCP